MFINSNQNSSARVNLDKRVRPDHLLRRVAAQVDFSFIRAEVGSAYGYNEQVSVGPVILLKLMFLLFWDDIPSERELMSVVAERLFVERTTPNPHLSPSGRHPCPVAWLYTAPPELSTVAGNAVTTKMTLLRS